MIDGRADRGWSAPGTILLAGEYRVTEENGLGIALAAGGRAYLHTAEEKNPKELLESVYRVLGYPPRPWRQPIIDTSAFYTADGSKWGLGSSAATSLLFTRFFTDADVLKNALSAHRCFQGGFGSGYDVYASYHGGIGLFKGGIQPAWTPLCWPEAIRGYLLCGPSPIRSPEAFERYSSWAAGAPSEAAAFRTRTDEEVAALNQQLIGGGNSGEMLALIRELGRLGTALGDAIGVPSYPYVPEELNLRERDEVALKCLGAGDELAILLFLEGALSLSEIGILDRMAGMGKARKLEIEKQGLSGGATIGGTRV